MIAYASRCDTFVKALEPVLSAAAGSQRQSPPLAPNQIVPFLSSITDQTLLNAWQSSFLKTANVFPCPTSPCRRGSYTNRSSPCAPNQSLPVLSSRSNRILLVGKPSLVVKFRNDLVGGSYRVDPN